jgi:hypothetical protein
VAEHSWHWAQQAPANNTGGLRTATKLPLAGYSQRGQDVALGIKRTPAKSLQRHRCFETFFGPTARLDPPETEIHLVQIQIFPDRHGGRQGVLGAPVGRECDAPFNTTARRSKVNGPAVDAESFRI